MSKFQPLLDTAVQEYEQLGQAGEQLVKQINQAQASLEQINQRRHYLTGRIDTLRETVEIEAKPEDKE